MSVFRLDFQKINLSGVGSIESLIDRIHTEHGQDKGFLICDPAMVELRFAAKLLGSDLNLVLFNDVHPNPDTNTVNSAYDLYSSSGANYIIGFYGAAQLIL